jgi:hypothetical protein
MHLAGLMRPTGRVFETPDIGRCFLMAVAIVIMKEIKKMSLTHFTNLPILSLNL